MAVGEASGRHIVRIVAKESLTGLALGAVMAVLMFGRGVLTNSDQVDSFRLGLTVAGTVLLLSVWAATVATILPVTLSKLRVDPAVVSAPFITSIIDASGVFIYFTIVYWLIL
jgi:magnesium transporter